MPFLPQPTNVRRLSAARKSSESGRIGWLRLSFVDPNQSMSETLDQEK